MSEAPGLPTTWTRARIDEVSTVNGRAFSLVESAASLPAAFVPMAAVTEEFGGIDVSAVRPLAEVSKGYTSFVEGDVLFAKITPCMENGKVAVVPPLIQHVGFGSTEFHVLRSNGAVAARWLAYYLSQLEFRRAARQDMTGSAGQLRVQSGWLSGATLPVAPLTEQQRILFSIDEVLSELDAGVAELHSAQAKLTQYRQSLLKAAVEGDLTAEWRADNPPQETGAELLARILREREANGPKREPEPAELREPMPLPDGWAWASLDQLLLDLRSGTAETSGREPTPYPVLKSSAVRQGTIAFRELNYFGAGQSARPDNFLQVGDLLITRLSGSVAYVGCCALVSSLPTEPIQYPDRIFCGRSVPAAAALMPFVAYCFQAPYLRQRLEAAAKSTAGHQRISMTDLRGLPLPLPPLNELLRIVELVQSADDAAREVQSAIEVQNRMAAAQRQNILRAAFSGQLVPQDPNDEPASVLLERIRAERAAACAASAPRPLPRRRARQLAAT